MQRFFVRSKFLFFLTALFITLSIVYIGYGLYVPSTCDGYYRWQESAYVLRGIDPFSVATGFHAPEADIGKLNADGGNMPWTYLLSNVIYPGFLPYSSALIWGRVLFVLLFVLTIARVWRASKQMWNASHLQSLALVSVLFACYMWFATLRLGNHGAYIMLLLILLFTFDHNRHWVLAGLCYAFLLMKPQTSGIFLLFFLLSKRWKPIFFAGGILSVLMVITFLLIRKSPLAMITDAYQLSVSYEHLNNYIYYGLLDPLVSVFGVRSGIVLPIGMALGISCMVFYRLRLPAMPETVNYAFAALLSMCWMYIQPSDMIVLGFVGFASLASLFFAPQLRRYRIWIAFGSILGAIPILGKFYMANPLVPLAVRILYIIIVAALIRAGACAAKDHRESEITPRILEKSQSVQEVL